MSTLEYFAWIVAMPVGYVALVELIDRWNQWSKR
jgi:hypothetical protein